LRAFPELGLSQNKTLFSECKNDIGVARTYHKAPPGFQSAAEISGVILKFLAQAAQDDDPLPLDRTVVTVPASFQAAQRQDTLRAAELAGIQAMSLGGMLSVKLDPGQNPPRHSQRAMDILRPILKSWAVARFR